MAMAVPLTCGMMIMVCCLFTWGTFFFWLWEIVWQVHPSLTSLGNVTRDGIQDTKSRPATSDAELTTTLPMVFHVHPRKKPQNCSMDLYHNVWKLKLQLFLVFCFVFWWVCEKLRLQNYPSHRARRIDPKKWQHPVDYPIDPMLCPQATKKY